MLKQYHTDGWRIYVGDVLFGIAYYRESDQPWYICDFEPTTEFETYRPLFDTFAALVNDPLKFQPPVDYFEYYETHIETLNLRLVPFGDVYQGEVFVGQIYNGNEAWLRPS